MPRTPGSLPLVELLLKRHGLLPLVGLRIAHAAPVGVAMVGAEATTRLRRYGVAMRRQPAGAVVFPHALVDQREGVDDPLHI